MASYVQRSTLLSDSWPRRWLASRE